MPLIYATVYTENLPAISSISFKSLPLGHHPAKVKTYNFNFSDTTIKGKLLKKIKIKEPDKWLISAELTEKPAVSTFSITLPIENTAIAEKCNIVVSIKEADEIKDYLAKKNRREKKCVADYAKWIARWRI